MMTQGYRNPPEESMSLGTRQDTSFLEYNLRMARPKATAGKKQVRKLTKVGGGKSYSLALPVEIIRKFKWKERQKLTVTVDLKNKKLVIRDWRGR